MEETRADQLIPARGAWMLSNMLSIIVFFATYACAQDLNAKNEFGAWFSGQFGSGHVLGSTINSRMYQFEGRYARLVYANRTLAVRYVAAVVPICAVGDPGNNGQPVYAYAAGASPIQSNSIGCTLENSSHSSQAVEGSFTSTGICFTQLS